MVVLPKSGETAFYSYQRPCAKMKGVFKLLCFATVSDRKKRRQKSSRADSLLVLNVCDDNQAFELSVNMDR